MKKKENLFEIWGILNLTPDSFYSESKISSNDILNRANEMLAQGADVLDIGAESSRPYAKKISWQEEWQRLEQPLKILSKAWGKKKFAKRVSIDSYKLPVVKKVLGLGVRIINDINGGSNKKILKEVAKVNGKIVIMHKVGDPQSMQENPSYDNVVLEVAEYLHRQAKLAQKVGIKKKNILIDPGIGFGKTLLHNITLLNSVNKLKKSSVKLLLGISRKSFIGEILEEPNPEARLLATQSLHTILAYNGVDILRVHDVAPANEIRLILKTMRKYHG